jgi:hypothetical protein
MSQKAGVGLSLDVEWCPNTEFIVGASRYNEAKGKIQVVGDGETLLSWHGRAKRQSYQNW